MFSTETLQACQESMFASFPTINKATNRLGDRHLLCQECRAGQSTCHVQESYWLTYKAALFFLVVDFTKCDAFWDTFIGI